MPTQRDYFELQAQNRGLVSEIERLARALAKCPTDLEVRKVLALEEIAAHLKARDSVTREVG